MTRVLLDEDIPIRLRDHFPAEIQVETVEYRGWKGLKNGALLTVAQDDFDVLVTMDDKLPDQQNLSAYNLAVVVLRAHSKRMSDLVALMPQIAEQVRNPRRGTATRIFPDRSPSDDDGA
jgi:predicted nuclease of predicted toxin-antitoxin system